MSELSIVLDGGEVLLRGPDVMRARMAIAGAIRSARSDGINAPCALTALLDLLSAAVERLGRTAVRGSAAVPRMPEVSTSPHEDLVDAKAAAPLLRCGQRNVRDLCRRGVFESARQVGGRWLIDRAEILDRARAKAS